MEKEQSFKGFGFDGSDETLFLFQNKAARKSLWSSLSGKRSATVKHAWDMFERIGRPTLFLSHEEDVWSQIQYAPIQPRPASNDR